VTFEIKIDVFFLYCSSEKVYSATYINTRTTVNIILGSYNITENCNYHNIE